MCSCLMDPGVNYTALSRSIISITSNIYYYNGNKTLLSQQIIISSHILYPLVQPLTKARAPTPPLLLQLV